MSFSQLLLNFSGEMAALAAAFFWTISSMLFTRAGQEMRPVTMNLFKDVLALALLSLTLPLIGERFSSVPLAALGLLLASGVIGIGIGDTAFFYALGDLGPRRVLLLGTLAPPLTGLIAWAFLGEALSWKGWLGMLVTAAGVVWVITEQSHTAVAQPARRGRGIALGLAAALAQASSSVISRSVLTQTDVSALFSAVIRLAAGVAVLVIWLLVSRQALGVVPSPRRSPRQLGVMLAASFIGAYVCMWLQQVAFQNAAAGVAQSLLMTSPVFILPLAALGGEKLTWRAVLGVFVAMAGIAMLFGWR
jgi:drug/metabolite transporter (DMT)-like permease